MKHLLNIIVLILILSIGTYRPIEKEKPKIIKTDLLETILLNKGFDELIDMFNDDGFSKVLDNYSIGERFGSYKKGSIRGYRHLGLDLIAPKNSDIYAPANLYIYDTGYLVEGGGKQVQSICKNNGTIYGIIFMHLNEIDCVKGGVVLKGNILGKVGKTGEASGYHCHIELYELGKGNMTDYIYKKYDSSFNVPRVRNAKGRLNYLDFMEEE